VIHYPSADADTPHLLNLPLKESLSQAEQLSFDVPYGNPGYGLIQGLITKVKVFDTRDNSVVFSGRVLNPKDGMGADSKFINQVTCEGALNYLCDSQTRRWQFINQTPTQILTYLLEQHNIKVEPSKEIHLGVVEITQSISVDTNYETTLNAIITKLHNILGGDLRVRETAGLLYLDYLTDLGENNGVEIRIGINAKQLIREYDSADLITRVIILGFGQGINQLDITTVNGNVEYLEDIPAIAVYGVIEGLVTNKDIQSANTLKIYGQTVLDEKKQPKLIIDTAMIDRSVLAEYALEKYNLGDTIHTIAPFLSIDVYARVIERNRDLINSPWDPKLIISTRPITLSTQIGELKQRNMNLENCPQGSTYIDTIGYAENIDATHPFVLPVWLSPDILYVNRVRLHIDSQKYRAYEKGIASAAAVTATSAGGGGSTATSSSGGGSTATSSSGGGGSSTSSAGGGQTTSSGGSEKRSSYEKPTFSIPDDDTSTRIFFESPTHLDFNGVKIQGHDHVVDTRHDHTVSDHSHSVSFPAHSHNVDIPAHSHSVDIPSHTHDVTIPAHTHDIQYGIFEDTYPADVTIKINGVAIPGVSLSGGGSLDMDISSYIQTPGATYDLEITSSQNGRVNVWCSTQAFIQIK